MDDAAGALRDAAKVLESISSTARLDAELLMAHALNLSREELLLRLPGLSVPESFGDFLERRQKSEPIAHIIGTKEFWGLEFQVSSDVLIPRPDSELLIEEALRLFAGQHPDKILDLGTGSGALLLAALSEFPQARGTGMDASAAALSIAHTNADDLNLSDRVEFVLQDWSAPNWQDTLHGPFDLILANPPYVAQDAKLSDEVMDFEPHAALFAGDAGMDDYRILIPALGGLLTAGGIALLEIGFDQQKPVSELAVQHGYHVESKQDLGGNDRLLILTQEK